MFLVSNACIVIFETCIQHICNAEVPSAPEALTISYTAASVYLLWSIPVFMGNSDILGYQVYQHLVDSQSTPQLLPSPEGLSQYTTNITKINITTNITPYTKYEFAVEACNTIGCSDKLMYLPFRTSPAGKCTYYCA